MDCRSARPLNTMTTCSNVENYTIAESGEAYCNEDDRDSVIWSRNLAIIGTGKALEQDVANRLKNALGFALDQSNLHWARAVVIGEAVADLISKDKALSETVGGPFQVVRITANGVETHYIWPLDGGDRNVEVRPDESNIIIRRPSTDESYTLHPVWAFNKDKLQGEG